MASSNALKLSLRYSCSNLSYNELHKLTNRVTPEMFSNFKLLLLLFKTFNNNNHQWEWTQLNFNMILISRQTKFITMKNNKSRIGLNILSNHYHCLNNQIPLDWFNKSPNSYKICCKEKLLVLKWIWQNKFDYLWIFLDCGLIYVEIYL
jgi:hypothetical protein